MILVMKDSKNRKDKINNKCSEASKRKVILIDEMWIGEFEKEIRLVKEEETRCFAEDSEISEQYKVSLEERLATSADSLSNKELDYDAVIDDDEHVHCDNSDDGKYAYKAYYNGLTTDEREKLCDEIEVVLDNSVSINEERETAEMEDKFHSWWACTFCIADLH